MAGPASLASVMPRARSAWYASALALLAVALLFTHACRYLYVVGSLPVPPPAIVVGLIALALPLLLLPQHARALGDSPLLLWAGLYLAMAIVGYFVSDQSDVARTEVFRRFMSTALLAVLVVILRDNRIHGIARGGVVAATVLGALLNMYELLRPLTFSPILGRSAGLYVNPNISGGALTVGMILGVDWVRPRYRLWYVLLVGVAVLLTLSRGAIGGWLLAVAVLGWYRELSLARLVLAGSGVAAALLFLLLVSGRGPALLEATRALSSPELARLSISSEGDFSANTRFEVAVIAWRLFANRPLLGNGIGATHELLLGQGSHNMYLRDLAESGILGLLVMPLFVLMAGWGARGRARPTAHTFSVFLLAWSLFSHDVLDEWQYLIAAALVSALAAESRTVPTASA